MSAPKNDTPDEAPSTFSTTTFKACPDIYLRSLIGLCAAGIIASFFLPWINFFMEPITGLQLAQYADTTEDAWSLSAVPILGGITFLTCLFGKGYRLTSLLTALAVGITVMWAFSEEQEIYRVFALGAWTTISLGGAMIPLAVIPGKSEESEKTE